MSDPNRINEKIMESDLRVSKHFPVVRPQCREVAAKFFFCFTKVSRHIPDDVLSLFFPYISHMKQQGAHGLALVKCQSEMRKYDECMSAVLAEEAEPISPS